MEKILKSETVLKVENYTKSFGTFVANDDISFELKRGEVLCLLGENGAGKSTLCKCLYGAYKPDDGKMFIKGEEVHLDSPKDAIERGIGMVHQHFVLAPPMTVLENIIVGTESPGFLVNKKEARTHIEAICNTYDLDINLDEIVSNLSVGQQQWVEILKSLYAGVYILILDEPTATLTPQESEKLYRMVKEMTATGMAVILITHKLYEVMDASDYVIALRKGKMVGERATEGVTKSELAQMMVGRNVSFKPDKQETTPGETVLSIKNVTVKNDVDQAVLQNLSLEVKRKEILGIAGVGGNGQDELFDVIAGVTDVDEGDVALCGDDCSNMSPAERGRKGLATAPPDRIKQGLLMDFSVAENMILGFHKEPQFKNKMFLSAEKIKNNAEELIKNFDIASSGPSQPASELSGGNLQKIILARELSHNVECAILSSPTRGLDVGAMEYVHRRVIELRDQGAGVLLISEDLDEVINVSDRIAVMYKGEIMGVFNSNEIDRGKLGLCMAGVKNKA